MGLVTSTTRFCYLECDRTNCSRKIYQFNETVLRELARLTGWSHKGNSWTCPACAEKSKSRRHRSAHWKNTARELTS